MDKQTMRGNLNIYHDLRINTAKPFKKRKYYRTEIQKIYKLLIKQIFLKNKYLKKQKSTKHKNKNNKNRTNKKIKQMLISLLKVMNY